MSDCECEKGEMMEHWPDERDVGDRFLRIDETPLISSIKDNIIRANVNTNAIFNRKMDEDRLDDLDLENVVVDYSFVDDEDETLVEYDIEEETVNYDEEEETVNYDEEEEPEDYNDNKEEPESEEDLEGEMEEIKEKEIEIQNPEVLEVKPKINSKNKVSDYLDDFL